MPPQMETVADASSAAPALSLKRRAQGRRRYYLFSFFNSISYATLAEGVVLLMLLRLGATGLWVGLVSSLMYVTLPFMLIGYYAVPRLGVTGAAALFWLMRSCSASLMIGAPWAAAHWGGNAGLWTMFLGSLGFMIGRAGGLAAFTGIITELTTRRERGQLITNSFKVNQTAGIAVTIALAALLGAEAPLVRYQALFGVGTLFGVAAAATLWGIPESGIFRQPAHFSLRGELAWILRTPGRSWFLAMMLALPVTQGLSRTFLIVVMKQGYGLSDQVTVMLVIASMLGGVIASYAYGVFLDQLGPRPLLVLTGFLDLAGAGMVVLLPIDVFWPLLVLMFAITGYVHVAFQTATQHYFISITDTDHQLPQGILTQGLGGLSGGAALVLGGWALEHTRSLAVGSADPLLHFRWFFAGIIVLLVLRMVIFFKIPVLQSQGIRDSLNALFSPWDWRAIHAVKRTLRDQTEDEEARALEVMKHSNSGIYQEDLERYLGSPSLFVRGRALDSLSLARPSPSLIDLLSRDVRENLYTTANQSAYWLGRWKVAAAVPLLREATLSPDFQLSGAAVRALVELEDRESRALIQTAFAESANPYVLIEGARALSLWGDPQHYAVLLDKYHLDIPPQAKDELSLSVTRLLGLYNPFYRDLGMLRREPAQLFREWHERFGAADEHGLIDAQRAGRPLRSLLQRTLACRSDGLCDWFVEATAGFLEKRPEHVRPEMAFMMTFLLLSGAGEHRRQV